jgi:lysyl-tRNA synthetase class 2
VIEALAHDSATNVLEVEFRTGRVYRYFLVPAAAYASLLQADSIGEHFNQEILNRYRSVEIGGDESAE